MPHPILIGENAIEHRAREAECGGSEADRDGGRARQCEKVRSHVECRSEQAIHDLPRRHTMIGQERPHEQPVLRL
jgi:hypothetical protein